MGPRGLAEQPVERLHCLLAERLALAEMSDAFREGSAVAAWATPGAPGGVPAAIGEPSHRRRVRRPRPPQRQRLLAQGRGADDAHSWCRRSPEPAVEDSATFKERLQGWPRDPGSQPDLERWYNDTARPFLERPAPRLEGLSGAGGLGSSSGGGSGGGYGGDTEERRRRRLGQLAAMTDAEFASEVRSHQQARWRRASLEGHARKHWRDFEGLFGKGLSPSELEEATLAALIGWDRLFTELDREGDISYAFAAQWTERGGILVVVTRTGRIRTALPMAELARWIERHPATVEVTERGKRLGL